MASVNQLLLKPSRWLVTGAAGFIGSNLLETLLHAGQHVVALDNLSTGHQRNLDEVERLVGPEAWARSRVIIGDIRDAEVCRDAVTGVDFVLHQAALGSVPRSIASPMDSFESNVGGFMQLLNAARSARVKRFVYASSSSVYGDHPDLPKLEGKIGRVLSPYAATKSANELFAEVFAKTYAMSCVGLRYFNVFGPRQDPDGAYAAVIPKWTSALLKNETVFINGDGETSRDFCFVANAVEANIRAAITPVLPNPHEVFNVAVGERTSLSQLFEMIRHALSELGTQVIAAAPLYRDFRAGDVRHSLADISKARQELGYEPQFSLAQGLRVAMPWYLASAAVR